MVFIVLILLFLVMCWLLFSKDETSEKDVDNKSAIQMDDFHIIIEKFIKKQAKYFGEKVDVNLETIPNKQRTVTYKTNVKNDDKKSAIQMDDFHIIVENFIKKTQAKYFLVPEYIGALDYCIVQKYKVYNLTFLQTGTKSNDRVENEEIKVFYGNEYDMFMQLVSKMYSGSSNLRIQKITYDLLKVGVIDYYAKVFENSYGSYFQEWDHSKRVEVIDIISEYLKIDSIVQEDPVLIGQLICYSIRKYNLKRDYLTFFNLFMNRLKPEIERMKLENFEKSLRVSNESLQYTIDDVDLMGGLEFEQFIAELFLKMGYAAEVTKASGDQGIDVIAEKNGRKIGIQAKCYSSKVTNSAIQEAVAGIQHYRLDKGMVITNNWFTASAQELAESNNIILWDRNRLKEKLSEVAF